MLVTDYPVVSVNFPLPKGVEVRKTETKLLFSFPASNLHVECEDNPSPALRKVVFSQMALYLFNQIYPNTLGKMAFARAKAISNGQEEPLWVTEAYQAKAALEAQFLCTAK